MEKRHYIAVLLLIMLPFNSWAVNEAAPDGGTMSIQPITPTPLPGDPDVRTQCRDECELSSARGWLNRTVIIDHICQIIDNTTGIVIDQMPSLIQLNHMQDAFNAECFSRCDEGFPPMSFEIWLQQRLRNDCAEAVLTPAGAPDSAF